MRALIIYAHPYEESFNHAVYQALMAGMEQGGIEFNTIDLYKDGFDPVYSESELKLFSKGETDDPLVKRYQEMILAADTLLFVFPVWWNDVPAIVKGFLDKVMKKQFAYDTTDMGITGKLNHIRSAVVYTTSTSPTWYLCMFAGNAIQSVFIRTSLKQIGIRNAVWHNFGKIGRSSFEKRKHYLERITARYSRGN